MTHTAATHIHAVDPPSQARQQYDAHKARLERLNGHIKEVPIRRQEGSIQNEWFELQITELIRANRRIEQKFEAYRAATNKEIGALRRKLDRLDLVGVDTSERGVVTETRPTIASIKKAVCTYFELNMNDLDSDVRSPIVARPRQIVMYLSRKHTLRSFADIGRLLGNREHATILHGCDKIETLVRKDWTVAFDVAMVEQLL